MTLPTFGSSKTGCHSGSRPEDVIEVYGPRHGLSSSAIEHIQYELLKPLNFTKACLCLSFVLYSRTTLHNNVEVQDNGMAQRT